MTMKNYNTNGLYLSKKTLVKAGIRKRIMVISGGILTVLFATSVLMAILDSGDELRQNLIVYVALLIPSVLLLYKGMKDGALTDLANRYNSIFECDRDGIVTISELTKQMGKATSKILSELEHLLEKGYLCNCSLQKTGQPCVILSDGRADIDGSGFVNVVCDICGGTTRLRAGSSGVCEYCGKALESKWHFRQKCLYTMLIVYIVCTLSNG